MAFIRLTFTGGGGGGAGSVPLADYAAKGDILVGTAPGVVVALPVGANGLVLTANSLQPSGVEWSAVAGTGDVVGPAGAVDANIALFDGITGKLLKDGGIGITPFVGAGVADGALGFVPQPLIADAANFRYLNADGNWEQLNQDQILPGFSIASFAKNAPGAAVLYERGDTLTGVTVAATYVPGSPVSATLTNTLGGSVDGGDVDPSLVPPGGWTFIAPFASGSQATNVKRSGTDAGADPTWTITLNATGTAADAASTQISWTRRVYWGVSLITPLTAADIVNVAVLANNVLSPSKSRTVNVNPVAQYVYYCFPASYGTVTMTSGGFAVDLEPVYTVGGVLNANGFSSTYNVYRTTYVLSGPFTIVVS